MRRQLHGLVNLHLDQSHVLEMPVVSHAFRWSKGPLAASSQVLRKTITNVQVDLSESHAWISEGEVVLPAVQVSVELLNQVRERLPALMTICHLMQLLPFPLQRFGRRSHVQILPAPTSQVAVVSERESQKVQLLSFFQIDDPRLLPIDLQTHSVFELGLDPVSQFRPL